MSTACGRPQGGEGSGPCGQGRGGQKPDFLGRHKWMTPKSWKQLLIRGMASYLVI